MSELAKALMSVDAKWIRLSKELNELTKNDSDAQAYAVNLFNLFLKSDSLSEDEMAEKVECIVEPYIASLQPKLANLDAVTKSDVAHKLVYDIRDKALELASRTNWIVNTFGEALSEKVESYAKTQIETRFSDHQIEKMLDHKLASKPLPVHIKLLEAAGINKPIRKSDLERFFHSRNNGHKEVNEKHE